MALKQDKGLTNATQHAQRQHVDFQDAQRIEIILVPFDHRAILHGGVLDRHHFVEPTLGDHEPADMLGKMARKANQLLGQL